MKAILIALSSSMCVALICSTPGCSDNPKHGAITGTVMLDGQPVKTGVIRFDPLDGRSATADATITDGKFTANVPPGEKRVSITSPKVVGKKKMYDTPDSPIVDLTEELLPTKYNSQSELKLTVRVGDQEPATFDLKSK